MKTFTAIKPAQRNIKFNFAFGKTTGLMIIVCIVFAACKKTRVDEKPGSHHKFDSSLSKVSLPQGSYFIYRDSATNNYDSVVVTKSLITPDLYQEGFDCSWLGPGSILNLPSITVQGELYTGIHRFETIHYTTSGSDHTISVIYWVPGIGIIKRSTISGVEAKTEELVRRG